MNKASMGSSRFAPMGVGVRRNADYVRTLSVVTQASQWCTATTQVRLSVGNRLLIPSCRFFAPPTKPLDLAADGHVAGPETSRDFPDAETADLVLAFNKGPIDPRPGRCVCC